jgi:ketosteroid isomerase-like protein
MNRLLIITVLISLLFFSCNAETKKDMVEKWKNEIRETEQNFSNMAKDDGIKKAFTTYAADNAVLMRNDKLIVGKNEINIYFDKNNSKDTTISLTWEPDFVDVAESGDLGYTYGKYTYSYIDSLGNRMESNGVFHTVWKRQPDKTWRFVWD